MSGTFGHEAEHRDQSLKIYSQSWQEKIDQYGDAVLVTGYSCRCQIKRLENIKQSHPLQTLLQILTHSIHD